MGPKTKRKPTGVLPLAVLAGVMTGAEAMVSMGVNLPFSDDIPAWARAAGIVVITGVAFVLRILAQRAAK